MVVAVSLFSEIHLKKPRWASQLWQYSNRSSSKTGHPLMPVVLKIDARRKIVYSTFYGRIDDAEVAGHRSRIASDPDFNAAFNEIVDFTAVTEAALSESTLAAMAEEPSLFSRDSLHVVVAPADLLFHLAGKYRGFARLSRPNLFVVRTRAEAYQLLGADFHPDLIENTPV